MEIIETECEIKDVFYHDLLVKIPNYFAKNFKSDYNYKSRTLCVLYLYISRHCKCEAELFVLLRNLNIVYVQRGDHIMDFAVQLSKA